MNLTVPGAVAALESAFSELLRGSPPGFESFEASAKRIANACCAEAMGTMGAERQHVYKVRMGSFPRAWPPEGADARARARSRLLSGFGLPRGTGGGVPLRGEEGAQGREAREARVLAARKPRTIRGEGVGVPPRRLGGRAGLRRQVQGVRRRPLGSSANINLIPTEEVHQDDAHDEDGYGGRRDAAQEELIVLQDVLDHAVVFLSFGFSF